MSSHASMESGGDTRVSAYVNRQGTPGHHSRSQRCSADHIITVETSTPHNCETRHLLHPADEELQVTLLPAPGPEEAALRRRITAANGLSWVVNIVLLVAKIWAYLASGSKAVLASAADSAVDLLSQVVITYTEWRMQRVDPLYPVGQARLEALGVLACACIMSVASFEVIQEASKTLYAGFAKGTIEPLELSRALFIVLGAAIALKLVCWIVCKALESKSDSMLALAEDHLNDIMSNAAAVATAVLAVHVKDGWWIDPVGAILISLYIVWRWVAIAQVQVHKIVGKAAPEDFVERLTELANSHHECCSLDVLRAYHFGSRYIVEMEIVLPADMSVAASHDISLDLQHKVEALEEVERAFVHVDYQKRDFPEHKVERALLQSADRSNSGSGSPLLLTQSSDVRPGSPLRNNVVHNGSGGGSAPATTG